MASTVPSEISTSLSASDGGFGDFLTNFRDVVQTVGSIYDQISGRSQSVPGQASQTYSQSPTVAASAPAQSQAQAQSLQASPGLSSGTALAVGAVVLIGVLLLLKD